MPPERRRQDDVRARLPAETIIRRRFASGLDNFHRHYKLAVDDWTLYDNSGTSPVMLELGDNA